jgi:hypothetical protein
VIDQKNERIRFILKGRQFIFDGEQFAFQAEEEEQ